MRIRVLCVRARSLTPCRAAPVGRLGNYVVRVRLLADGALKGCLFAAAEVSLRAPLREGATDAELAVLIAAAVARKKPAHDGIPVARLAAQPNRAMIRIGG